MSFRLLVVALAVAGGLVGLALDFWVIAGVMGPPQNRTVFGFLVYYLSFLTNLSNIALLFVYASDFSRARWLGWFRAPVTRAGMAGIMVLVMGFFHIMLAPAYHFEGPIVLSNFLLHTATPLLYLLWWALCTPHGTLRYRDVPAMLVPGLAYVLYIELRGPLAGEYPYTILDPNFAPPGGTAAGYVTVLISVIVLVAMVAIFDLLLVAADGLMGRLRRAG